MKEEDKVLKLYLEARMAMIVEACIMFEWFRNDSLMKAKSTTKVSRMCGRFCWKSLESCSCLIFVESRRDEDGFIPLGLVQEDHATETWQNTNT